MSNYHYKAVGPDRGDCGHQHATIAEAMACVQKDCEECEAKGGYGDRDIHRSDGKPLTETEERTVVAWLEALP